MRQGSNVKRSRNRGSRRGHNPRSHTLDSNGPSVRIRGNANQIYEKYQQLARDAQASGDRINAENLMQHAEHYYRLASAAAANGADPRRGQPPRTNGHAPEAEDGAEQPAPQAAAEEPAAPAAPAESDDQNEPEPQPA